MGVSKSKCVQLVFTLPSWHVTFYFGQLCYHEPEQWCSNFQRNQLSLLYLNISTLTLSPLFTQILDVFLEQCIYIHLIKPCTRVMVNPKN